MSRIRYVFVFALSVGVVVFSAGATARNKHDMTTPVCGPWLQNASETTMSVCWITKVPCAAAIEYRKKGTVGWIRHWETIGDKLAYTHDLHVFHIKELQPASEYEYRLLSSLSRYEQAYAYTQIFTGRETYSFRTFDRARESYSVFLASDMHGYFDVYGERLCRRPDVVKSDFAVFLGDQVDDNMNQPRYFIVNGYLDAVSRLWGSSKSTVFVRGNHECWGAHAAQTWMDYHARPDGVSYYFFSHGPVLYVVLDRPHDYSHKTLWQVADAAAEVSREFEERQFSWFQEIVKCKDWKEATFRVVLCHYPARLTSGDSYSPFPARYKPLMNGPNGVHLFLCGHEHYAASSLPGEVGCYHNPRHDPKDLKKRDYKMSDGSFDYTEVCTDIFGSLLLDVTKDKMTIRILDCDETSPDLDCIEIRPDKLAFRLQCPES